MVSGGRVPCRACVCRTVPYYYRAVPVVRVAHGLYLVRRAGLAGLAGYRWSRGSVAPCRSDTTKLTRTRGQPSRWFARFFRAFAIYQHHVSLSTGIKSFVWRAMLKLPYPRASARARTLAARQSGHNH